MSIGSLVIRFKENIRIYQDSSNVTVTYADLARVYEDMLELIEVKKVNGFKEV